MDASHIVMKMCVNNDINERNSNEKGYVSSGGGDGGRRKMELECRDPSREIKKKVI